MSNMDDIEPWCGLENDVYLQRLNGSTICVIFVYAMPLAGTKLWERVFTSSAKLQLPLPVRWLERRMRIQNVELKIHFPVPKCLCKQGTKKGFNNRLKNNYWTYQTFVLCWSCCFLCNFTRRMEMARFSKWFLRPEVCS